MKSVPKSRRRRAVSAMSIAFLLSSLALSQGTPITAPQNSYAVAEDVKVGREAAAEVSKEMPLLPENGEVDNYVERVGRTLAAAIPDEFRHSEFQYDFSVVNASDINAFALPGGPMFINRGMIEAAHSEGEMAGVMAHEISHVALRHGTAQATKSQNPGVLLGTIGGAILGAVIGGRTGDIVSQGTQLGMGAYLLKFSREYETDADILGSQILARAGYDPMDLAKMFQTIEHQGGSNGPEWLSSHPNPGNRQERISQEARMLTIARGNNPTGQFQSIQTSLKRMPPAPTMEEIARKSSGGSTSNRQPDDGRIQISVELPATRYRTYEAQGVVKVSVPANWQEYGDSSSVTFSPIGAHGNYQGASVFTHGATIGVVSSGSAKLQPATDAYIAQLLKGNGYLRAERDYRQSKLDGRKALLRKLSGVSPVTGRRENVDVYTTLVKDGELMFMVHVAPEQEYSRYTRAFGQMTKSIRILR